MSSISSILFIPSQYRRHGIAWYAFAGFVGGDDAAFPVLAVLLL
jgi:hypothetical protein